MQLRKKKANSFDDTKRSGSFPYSIPKLLFHERFKNVQDDVDIERSIDVMHSFSADGVHILLKKKEMKFKKLFKKIQMRD